MIRFRNEIFEDYFIDPETAIITDKNGNEQETKIINGRMLWRGKPVYQIQMHTHNGYIKNKDIHHLDRNKLNDALNNLVYLSHLDHAVLHDVGKYERTDEFKKKMSQIKIGQTHNENTKKKISETLKNRKDISEIRKNALTDEVKQKISQTLKGKFKGKIFCNNGIKNIRVDKDNIPEGFVKGRLKKRPNK